MNSFRRFASPLVTLMALLLLAGCVTDATVPSLLSKLPPPPADIARCFNQSIGVTPARDLSVEQVERAWKSDRLRFVVIQRCGQRFNSWYASLRRKWK